jgi:hypothetical protein
MSISRPRLIEAAVRPFADNAEMRLSASKLLEELVGSDAADGEEMVRRWESVDARKRRPVWRLVLYAVLAAVSTALVNEAVKVVIGFENTISTMGGSGYVDFFHNSSVLSEEEMARKLAPDEALLLFGDLSRDSESERLKALWDSEPGNPAYFAQYVNAYLEQFKKLPPDFLKDARRIDPENAWFTYVAAGVRAKDATKKRPPSKAAKAAHATPDWDINDAAALRDSLELLREARNQPKCESYRNELGGAQMRLLPTGTPAEVAFSLCYRFGKSTEAELAIRHLGAAMAAKAWLCGVENDSDSFKDLLTDADGFLRKRLVFSEVDSLVGELVTMRAGYDFISNAAPSAERLGFADEAKRLAGIWERIKQRDTELQGPRANPNGDLLQAQGGSMASSLTVYSRMRNPPPLTLEDLEPGRLMDHETLAWTVSHFVWALLIAGMGLAAVSRYRSPVLIRRLTARLESLMLPRDWVVVFAAGVVVPMVYFLAITRLTPLGGRELSMEYGNFDVFYFDDPPLALAQASALALLVIFSSGTAACWRLRVRTKALGLVTRFSAGLLVPIACLAAFIPVSGWSVVHFRAYSDTAAATAWAIAGIALTWGFFVVFQTLFGQPRTQLRHGTVARMLIPSCAFAALLALSAAPFFKMRAFHWSSKDMLVRTAADYPSGSAFEQRVALQLRKEISETLGFGR